MSIARTQSEPVGKTTLVQKRGVSLQKVAEKTIDTFKDNTPGFLFTLTILITGVGELIGSIDWKWYIFLGLMFSFYVASYFHVSVKPLSEIFNSKK